MPCSLNCEWQCHAGSVGHSCDGSDGPNTRASENRHFLYGVPREERMSGAIFTSAAVYCLCAMRAHQQKRGYRRPLCCSKNEAMSLMSARFAAGWGHRRGRCDSLSNSDCCGHAHRDRRHAERSTPWMVNGTQSGHCSHVPFADRLPFTSVTSVQIAIRLVNACDILYCVG